MSAFKKMFRNIILTALVLFFIVGCGKNDLPEFNQLSKIRVLALSTATPEVNPGASVTLTPVISDINASAPLNDSVAACVDIGIAYGVLPNCDNNPTKTVIHANRNLTLPGQTQSWTGSADSFSVNVPTAAVIFKDRSQIDQYNGINYLIEYTLKNVQGEEVKSFRRIVVSDPAKTAKNQNPSINDIFANGQSLITLNLGAVLQLSTDLTSNSMESYSIQLSDGSFVTKSEYLSVTWLITDGETKHMRSDLNETNQYTAPQAMPVGRSIYLLAIARDNRGGVSVVKKKF